MSVVVNFTNVSVLCCSFILFLFSFVNSAFSVSLIFAPLKSKKKLSFHLLPDITPKGVPRYLKDSVIPFRFNNWEDLEKIVKKNAKKCAAIVIEPARESFPEKKFLYELRKIANKYNTVLIFDEITSGWRMNIGGIHKLFKVNPDIVVYGKTIANGIPMGVIVGKKKIIRAQVLYNAQPN